MFLKWCTSVWAHSTLILLLAFANSITKLKVSSMRITSLSSIEVDKPHSSSYRSPTTSNNVDLYHLCKIVQIIAILTIRVLWAPKQSLNFKGYIQRHLAPLLVSCIVTCLKIKPDQFLHQYHLPNSANSTSVFASFSIWYSSQTAT